MSNILEALKYIDVSKLTYQEWINIGMGLKAEGFDFNVWDEWSKNDTRYKEGECEKKWRTFAGSSTPISGGTIIKMAKENGWVSPINVNGGIMEWDDIIEYDGDGLLYDPKSDKTPTEQLITYIETLFNDDELVGFVTADVWKNDSDNWIPGKGYYDRTAKELINELKKYPDDIGAVLGDWKDEVGAWIRF